MLDGKLTLILMVFLLGIRHGFEPDHLAVIDGMAKCMQDNSKLSKYTGFLFAFGHGSIIILLTIFIGFEAEKLNIPPWLDELGIWISILFLIFFGLYNLYTTLKFNQNNTRKLLGPKSFLLSKFTKTNSNPSFLMPVFVGMLFSLSFDTISLTTAFSLSGYALAGAFFSILLGIIFMFGMTITDGLNGFVVAHILNRADMKSQFISRLLGLMIGSFSLIMGGFYLLKFLT